MYQSEDQLPDGVHTDYYYPSNQPRTSVTIKNGKQHGAYTSYHENGQICDKKTFVEDKLEGIHYLHNKEGICVSEIEYLDDKYTGVLREYHENGALRLQKQGSSYTFFDEQGIKKCAIQIQGGPVAMDEYRENSANCWYQWIWNFYNARALYTPQGIWTNFKEDGRPEYSINFVGNALKTNPNEAVAMSFFEEGNQLKDTQHIVINDLHIERFIFMFNHERLVLKEGNYPTSHNDVMGWKHQSYHIKPVRSLRDVISFESIA